MAVYESQELHPVENVLLEKACKCALIFQIIFNRLIKLTLMAFMTCIACNISLGRFGAEVQY